MAALDYDDACRGVFGQAVDSSTAMTPRSAAIPLPGGAGSDTLDGGGGVNLFIWAQSQGIDTILDFDSQDDSLSLSAGPSESDLAFTFESGNTLIETSSARRRQCRKLCCQL